MGIRRAITTGLACLAFSTLAAAADEVEDFYRGRQIDIVVGTAPGGGYDIYARMLAQHMPRFLPGCPLINVRYMPGAAGLRATNYLYASAPKDGTVIGTFARDMAVLGVLGGNPNVQFDVRKFIWLGSMSSFASDGYMLWARRDAHIKSLEDARKPGVAPLLLGASGAASSSSMVPNLLHDTLGLSLKVINGYQDSAAVGLAVDRGEVEGQFASFTVIHHEKAHWLTANSPVRALLQFVRTSRHPLLPDVPTARELAPNDRAKLLIEFAEAPYLLSRPFAAPPGVPPARAAALRKAFMDVQTDPAYLADAERLKADVSPMSGDDILALIERLATASPDALDYMRKALGPGGE